MPIKQKLKNYPFAYNSLLGVLNLLDYFNKRFWIAFPKYSLTETWRKRIQIVRQSPDNAKIDTVADAGKIMRDHQVMHNGLKITLGSYYDYGNTILLQENRGIHEPQEEYVFQEVLKTIPPGSCMMELGSYWAFYSLWFATAVKNARCVMIEPDPHKMNFGKLNFTLNKCKGTFDLGFIGQHTDLKPNIPFYTVDFLIKKHGLEFLHILHSDIQGFEYKMLQGASESIDAGKIGYVFVSTHSNALHTQCHDFLLSKNFSILCSANLDESYSWDGVLVAKSSVLPGPAIFAIDKRSPEVFTSIK